jgi:hypothetical protein
MRRYVVIRERNKQLVFFSTWYTYRSVGMYGTIWYPVRSIRTVIYFTDTELPRSSSRGTILRL